MNKYLLILFLPLFSDCNSQTYIDVTEQYIQNPSFEEYTSCPQSNSAFPSSMWIDSVVGWYAPTAGTSDYFNACNTTINGVPNNWTGNNIGSFHGLGYCGFLSYSLEPPNYSMWSEYIQTKLLHTLKPSTTYQFTMRVRRANGFNLAVRNIGARFSNLANSDYSTTEPYNLLPTVINQTDYLTDTLAWTLVTGQFVANGYEGYLTIGWFGDTISDDYTFFIPPTIDPANGDSLYLTETYYFVDSLTLSEVVYDFENYNVNVLTPNKDGINDVLDFSFFNFGELSFKVLNRWGNIVFQSDESALKWDGLSNNGKKLSDGVYYYIIEATLSSGKKINKNNFIHIIY